MKKRFLILALVWGSIFLMIGPIPIFQRRRGGEIVAVESFFGIYAWITTVPGTIFSSSFVTIVAFHLLSSLLIALTLLGLFHLLRRMIRKSPGATV